MGRLGLIEDVTFLCSFIFWGICLHLLKVKHKENIRLSMYDKIALVHFGNLKHYIMYMAGLKPGSFF
jgi:hypothetical protein